MKVNTPAAEWPKNFNKILFLKFLNLFLENFNFLKFILWRFFNKVLYPTKKKVNVFN